MATSSTARAISNVRQHDALNANDWVDNHTGHPGCRGRRLLLILQGGGGIGGPVPGTHKKVFFYGGIEIPVQNQGNANVLKGYVPSPEMLKGNFSTDNPDNLLLCPGGFYNSAGNGSLQPAWCNNIAPSAGNTNSTILPDGSTPRIATSSVPVVPGGALQQQGTAAGGYINPQYIDPNMLAFAKAWPAWNSPYIATTQSQIIANGGFNYYQPIVNHDNGWLGRGRIDFNWNSTNQFYISYQQSYDSQLANGAGTNYYSEGALQYPGVGIIKKTYSKVLTGHYVHIFSPTLTNEALASWVWGNIPIVPANASANLRSTLGFSAACVYCTNPQYMPTFGGTSGGNVAFGFPGITQADDWEPGNYYIVQKSVPTFADNVTKLLGKHTLKFGAMTSNTDNYQGNQSTNLQGQLTVGGTPAATRNYFATQGTCSVCGGYGAGATQFMGSYNPTVNFLMGNLTNYAESSSSPLSDVAYQTVAFYANDQIKVNRKLSVEVGFRFEHIGFWYDRDGVGLAVFDPQRVLPDFYAGKYAPGFYWHAIDSGVPLSGRPDRLLNVSPRFGLSYDVFGTGKTLLRGGWGAYRYQEAANAPQAALNTAQGVKNFSANSVLPGGTSFLLSQIGQLQTLAPNCQVQCPQSAQTGYSPNNYGVPLTYSYNFTIDQQLPAKLLLDVAYVGNHAFHMSDNGMDGVSPGNFDNQNKTPLNAYGHLNNGQWVGNVDPFTQKTICNPENLNATCSAAPGSGSYDFQPYGRATGCTSVSSSYNPNCLIYGANGVTMIQNNAYQNYNALQVSLVKRSGPITLNTNFTWSKSLGTVVNWNPYVMSANNTYDNLNRPFVFNAAYVYRQPNFYHGNRFISGAVNGWTISGITLWQKGVQTLPNISIQYDPASIPAAGNPQSLTTNTLGVGQATFYGTNAGMITGRPQLTCDPKSGLVYHQLYRPCFTAAPFGSGGGLGLPFIAGQAFLENDLAIYKTFTIHEQNKVQFRVSAFNWLNHPLPTFAPSNESNTEYFYYNYQTHAITPNDSTNHGGSGNPGSPILASTTYGNANNNPGDLFGTMHYKNGYGGNSQRIMEFDVKYSF